MRRSERGFTIMELAIVLVVIGIIAAVAVPHYVSLLNDTKAMQLVANVYAVRAAAYLYYGDNARWPAETPMGMVPPELTDKLPPGFTFVQLPFQLDWENWSSRTFPAGDPRNGVVAGISIDTRDTKMLAAVVGLLGKTRVRQVNARHCTLELAGPSGI
jgi:prepilin-type N-terminal cleavage/methylation domain-containing protein